MRLYIVRHGEASRPAAGGEQALTERGFWQAGQAAGLLAVDKPPQLILHSPKRRAVQTMQQITSSITDARCQLDAGLVPESNSALVEKILESRSEDSIALVSHLPLVAELVSWFSAGEHGAYHLPGYTPAGVVALDMEPVAARGCGQIAWYAFAPDYTRRNHATGENL